MPSLSYCTVGSHNLDQAKLFYDGLLGSIGWGGIIRLPDGGRIYGDGASMFGVLAPYNGQAPSVGNGAMFGFRFDNGNEVQAFHAKAIELGATNEGDPGERTPGAYFAYFRDLDGNKLCAYSLG